MYLNCSHGTDHESSHGSIKENWQIDHTSWACKSKKLCITAISKIKINGSSCKALFLLDKPSLPDFPQGAHILVIPERTDFFPRIPVGRILHPAVDF